MATQGQVVYLTGAMQLDEWIAVSYTVPDLDGLSQDALVRAGQECTRHHPRPAHRRTKL